MKIAKSQLKQIIKEELESVMEAAPMPYGIEQRRKERDLRRDRERANLPRTYYGAVDDSAKRAREKAQTEAIIAARSEIMNQFEETLQDAHRSVVPRTPGEDVDDFAIDDAKGAAAAFWFFRKSGRFMPHAHPNRRSNIWDWEYLARLFHDFKITVEGRINDANWQMKDKDWGSVMGQPGMNVVAQEWEHVKKILNASKDSVEGHEAWKDYGEPYINSIVGAPK
jgi:hypothetical protein